MADTLRSLMLCAVLFPFLASGTAFARQVRDRELQPAFDLTKIQMPVKFLSVKLRGKAIRPGEKIRGNDDWLRGLAFTLKNISDKPIAYVSIGLRFPRPDGFVVYSLHYGVDLSRGGHRGKSSPPAIQPEQTVDLVLTKEEYKTLISLLFIGGASMSFDTVPYFIERVCFEGEPDIIWEGGDLKRRDPNHSTEFNTIERYALPPKQK